MVRAHEGIFAGRYGLAIGPDLFFDCKAMKCQGRFSDEIASEKERLWYIRALRIGTFLFNGKLGVGFSCRSLGCQRRRCPLNSRTGTEKIDSTEWIFISCCKYLREKLQCPWFGLWLKFQRGSASPFMVLDKPTMLCQRSPSIGKSNVIRKTPGAHREFF